MSPPQPAARSGGRPSLGGEHAYAEAGVYAVTVTVTDDDGASATQTYEFVVYDPGAGFVTGGGWIESPEGATTPTGQTEFQFRVADLNFHSDSYDWLVIAGAKAMYKGTGTINGEGEYRFILSAVDADVNDNDAHTVDRFRIKIWDQATGEVI